MGLKDLRYAALDVETTGLSPVDGHEIVEVGLVAFRPSGIEERWSTLVKPGRSIPPEASAVHGIRQADVERAPAIAEVLPRIESLTAGRVLVLHNAPFDLEFLTSACFRNGREPMDFPLIDTLLVSRRAFPDSQGHTLTEVAARLGVAPEGAHRALPDAITTANVWMAMLRRVENHHGVTLLLPPEIERIERHPALADAVPVGG